MYSWSTRLSTAERTTRVKPASWPMAMAQMSWTMPLPKPAAMARASSTLGMEMRMSKARMSRLSNRPP